VRRRLAHGDTHLTAQNPTRPLKVLDQPARLVGTRALNSSAAGGAPEPG
jgi:hypothetical protein